MEVLYRMGKECEILMMLKTQKLENLGHIIRNQKLPSPIDSPKESKWQKRNRKKTYLLASKFMETIL